MGWTHSDQIKGRSDYTVRIIVYVVYQCVSEYTSNPLLVLNTQSSFYLLTHGSGSGSGPGPRDLAPVRVHTPAVAGAAVALGGLVRPVLVAGGDVLAGGGVGGAGPTTAELHGFQEPVPVVLTRGLSLL